MNQEIISRYIRQPARLPAELRARIEREWGGRPVQLYALADLDQSLRLSEAWLALGVTKTGMVYRLNGNEPQSHE